MVFGAALLLARQNSDLLKLILLFGPMIGHTLFTAPENTIASWEKENQLITKCGFELQATDLENQRDTDPLINPLCITDQEAKSLPNVVLQTSEFDFLRRETHIMIPILKKAGVYRDHMDFAGVFHGFFMMEGSP